MQEKAAYLYTYSFTRCSMLPLLSFSMTMTWPGTIAANGAMILYSVIIVIIYNKTMKDDEGRQMENLLIFLKKRISEQMQLTDIVHVFEKMCSIPLANDMILFETGTFSFTGEPLFYFSLVRQFPNDDEEFYQIHVDVLYKSTRENKMFNETTWSESLNKNIFD